MTIQKNTSLVNQICAVFAAPASSATMTTGANRFFKTVNPGPAGWNKIYFSPGSAEFTEKEKEDEPGTVFEQALKFDFPGEDTGNTASLDAFRRPLIILIKYAGGQYKIIGSPENGAEMAISQKQSAKNNNQEVTFSCSSQEKAWWLEIPSGSQLPEGGQAD